MNQKIAKIEQCENEVTKMLNDYDESINQSIDIERNNTKLIRQLHKNLDADFQFKFFKVIDSDLQLKQLEEKMDQ